MEPLTYDNQLNNNDKKLRVFNFFWIGFVIYTSAFTISTTQQVNYTLCNLFQILGLLILIPSSIILIQLKGENKYLLVILIIYCFWLLGVVLRGFLFEYEFLKHILFNAYEGVFIYVTPLIVLFPKNLLYLKRVFIVVAVLGIIYLFYDLLFIKALVVPYNDRISQSIVEYFTKTLSIPCGLILLTYIYHSKKLNLLALSVTTLTFLFAIIRARRGLAFLAFCPIIVSYIIYLVYSKNKVLKIVFFIIIAILLTVAIAHLHSLIGYFSDSSLTSMFVDRIGQDSRSEVEQYFYRDLTTRDWIIGKGINGHYFFPGVDEGPGRISIFRRGIETDYLNIILKGGILSLGLKLLIAIPALIKGLFHSKNMLAKASAIWILFYLVDLYPATVTAFTMNYLLVWISIGICYSRELRNMSDSTIKEVLLSKKVTHSEDDKLLISYDSP